MSTLLKMPRFLILMILVSFPVFSAVLFTPGIPDLARTFSLSDASVQWAMSIFLLGYCLGQLPYGPIANRIGRKKTIYLGLAVSFVGCLTVLFSHNFSIFCLGRFIEALGAAVGLKVTFTMIGDLHDRNSSTKAIGYITTALALMQGVGVAIGGFVVEDYGWRGSFVLLLIFTVFLFFCCLALPETSKDVDRDALRIGNIGRGYARQFKDPFLVLHGLLRGCGLSAIYIFATEAPAVAINLMGVSPEQYGLFSLIPCLGSGIGFFTAGKIGNRVPARISMASGLFVMLLGVLVMGLFLSKLSIGAWGLFIPTFLVWLGGCYTWVFASSVGISEATDKSNASAVIQFINVATAVASTFLVGTLSPKSLYAIPGAFGILIVIMFTLWISLRAHHRKRSHS